MKKAVISLVLVAALGLGGAGVYKGVAAKAAAKNTTSQVSKVKASVQNIQKSVSGSGSVLSAETDILKAASRDTVASVLVSKNQTVTKGQELITFDNGSDAITAPYDGVISSIDVSAGDSVNASQQLLTIFDNKHFYTTISVDEADLPALKIGQKSTIKVNAYSDTKFTGTVKDISQQGTYSNGVSNFDVTISFDNINNIKAGMSTEATIVTESKDNVLAIPVEAVKDMRNGKYVIIPNADGSTALQKVEVGISNGKMVEVTNGLVAGQEVEIPQVQSTNSNSSRFKGMGGGFQMMQGGGTRSTRSSGGQNKSN